MPGMDVVIGLSEMKQHDHAHVLLASFQTLGGGEVMRTRAWQRPHYQQMQLWGSTCKQPPGIFAYGCPGCKLQSCGFGSESEFQILLRLDEVVPSW